jgi:PIN domain nuclease of toxin-antitoxin system
MNEVVLDASAVLAVIQHERGTERLTADVLSNAVISAVNLAEVQSKLVKNGFSPAEGWNDALELVLNVQPFTSGHARIAGDLIATTEQYGLSLGDRSCLALAISLKAPVYTTEQAWRNLKLGIPIHVIR